MENRINIAELLRECPEGMELDCVLFDGVVFDEIDDDEYCGCPIAIKTKEGETWNLTSTGCWDDTPSAKCVIFPKGKTTWEGFVPPCQFKDGDIIFTHANCLKVGVGNTWISIFKERRNGGVATYVDYAEDGGDYYSDLDGDKALLCMESDILRQRFATEEEKEKLFKAIKDNGYKWNPETKTLDKLIQPKFKVGDRVKQIGSPRSYIIRSVEFDRYILHNNQFIRFKDEHIYELVNKFDISTLIPFESRVLVRDHNKDVWRASFWGCLINNRYGYNYDTTRGYSKQCIPYEGNEHLLSKTDDCKNFYKTWE